MKNAVTLDHFTQQLPQWVARELALDLMEALRGGVIPQAVMSITAAMPARVAQVRSRGEIGPHLIDAESIVCDTLELAEAVAKRLKTPKIMVRNG